MQDHKDIVKVAHYGTWSIVVNGEKFGAYSSVEEAFLIARAWAENATKQGHRVLVLIDSGLRPTATVHQDMSERPKAVGHVNRQLAPWQTRRAIEFVEANLAGTIRIEDLAEVARLSARQFSRAFRDDFGEAPYAYVVRRRIERAKEMMLITNEPLANVAAKCGLSDQSHLTRLFRRIVGESPGCWRRAHR